MKTALKHSLLAMGTTLALTAGAAGAAEKLRWNVPVAFATNLPALGDNIAWVSDQLKVASDNTILLKVSEPGKLVPAFQIVDAVREKKVEAGYTWLGYDTGKIPSSALFSAVPFGMEPQAFVAWWYEAGGHKLAEEVYAAQKVHPVLCGIIGPEGAGWFRKEIKSIDDFKGLKIRFAGLGGKVMQKLGASVTQIPGGEIFPALEKGAIDATEFSLPVIDQKLGFDKIVKNYHFPGWHQPFTAFHLVVNKEIWDKLQPSSRAMLELSCTAGVLRNLAKGEALEGPVLAEFKKKGVNIRVFPESVLKELRKVTQEVLDEESAKDPLFKKIRDSQKAFETDYRTWETVGYPPRNF